MIYDYVPKEYEGNILKYKYSGVDQSLLYKYIFSPIANFSLKIVPLWIAPNTLTLIGFFFILIPYLIFAFMFGNDWNPDVPQWLLFITTFLFFTYMNFDNMDGKQARRTGSASPLGMLLDHQMDAMIVVLEAQNVSQSVRLLSTINSNFIFACPAYMFYITTLQAYYTGAMELPIINAASEGVLSVGLFLLYTLIAGQDAWIQRLPWFYNFTVVHSIQILFLVLVVTNAPFIYLKIYRKNPKQFKEAFLNSIFGIFIIVSNWIVILISPANVGGTHLRQLFMITGFTFSAQVGIIQVYHVCEIPLPILRLPGLLINGSLVLNTILAIFKLNPLPEVLLLNILAPIAILLQFHFIFNMCRQFKKVLKIDLFSLQYLQKQK
ncbi:hypothetical protein pb186bvf_020875 [Paramecium bursaria]